MRDFISGKNKTRITAFFLFTIGIFVLFGGLSAVSIERIFPAGLAFSSQENSSYLGTGRILSLFCIAIGSILILSAISVIMVQGHGRSISKEKGMILHAVEKYKAEKISARETAYEIDRAVGGIRFVRYKADSVHFVSARENEHEIPLIEGKRAEELAMQEYLLAAQKYPEYTKMNDIKYSESII